MNYPQLADRILQYLLDHSTNNYPEHIGKELGVQPEIIEAAIQEISLVDSLGFQSVKGMTTYWILPNKRGWVKEWLANGGIYETTSR